jgi:integrase
MKNATELLTKDHKRVEEEIIEFIITSKEKGMKRAAISNYVKPVVSFCKINDILLNTSKINKFMPAHVKSKKTYAYSQEQIQRLLDIADERMSLVILLLSSTGIRIGAVSYLTVGNCEPLNDLYKITVYENEPEEYTVFCTSECKRAITDYLKMRERYGEVITSASPLVREQFDKRDPFAIAHPHRIKEPALARKLTDLAQDAGIRTKIQLEEGQKAASVRKDVPVCNGFRRYYCGVLADSGLLVEKRWKLEGHNLKGNDSSYLKITTESLFESFLLAHDNLLIDQSHKLEKKCERLEAEAGQLQRLQAAVQRLEAKIK